jgi:hypothetical protein
LSRLESPKSNNPRDLVAPRFLQEQLGSEEIHARLLQLS